MIAANGNANEAVETNQSSLSLDPTCNPEKAIPQKTRLKSAVAFATGAILAFSLSLSASTMAFAAESEQVREPSESSQRQDGAEVTRIVEDILDSNVVDAIEDDVKVISSAFKRTSAIGSVLAEAASQIGKRYAYGAQGPNSFDCSGFVKYVFSKTLGMDLPRSAAAQSYLGEDVSFDELQPGDLLFWGKRSGVYHVGIYTGDGSYIHAARSGKGVVSQSMASYTPSFAKRIY